ncbi:hypothetical protein K438DRAFT_1569650, partial [Mycena galopus ATCC 62051]
PQASSRGAKFVSYKEKMAEFLTDRPGFCKHLMSCDNTTKDEKDAHKKAMDTHEDEMDEYLQKQAAIASILTNFWPDDIHQQPLSVHPVHKLWDSLCALFENKSVLLMVDLLVDLLRIECTGKEDEDMLAIIDQDKLSDGSEQHTYIAAVIADRALHAFGGKSICLLDMGISQHYERDKTYFIDMQRWEPYHIETASGIEYATQIGTVGAYPAGEGREAHGGR